MKSKKNAHIKNSSRRLHSVKRVHSLKHLLMEQTKKSQNSGGQPNPNVMQHANEIRSKANKMTDEQRHDAFHYGMQLIYGGSRGNATAKIGRS